MSYDKIRFIAYAINTGPQGYVGSQTYLGVEPPQNDIDARCTLMMRAITTAKNKIPLASPPESGVLNVFMAPEFFFRGNKGAYDMDNVSYAIEKLQKMVAADEWKDWVFVFGTILGFSSSDNTDKKEVYNFSLIQQGGVASGSHNTRVVTKELKSGIDFIAASADPDAMLLGEVEHMASGYQGPGKEKQQVNYDGAGIFELAGVTWGLEICLDHLQGVNRLLNSPSLPGETEIQVQLVPSGGMNINAASVVAQEGGYVFNCDGLNIASSKLDAVGAGVPPALTDQAFTSTPVDGSDVNLPDSPPTNISVDQLYPMGAGKIDMYESVVTPAKKIVSGDIINLPPWKASDDYTFDFKIVYDSTGKFSTVLCRISSEKINFNNHNYYLPLNMIATDNTGSLIAIIVEQIAGTNGYDWAIECNIQVSDFRFGGIAFEFMNNKDNKEPRTIW